MFSLDHSFAEDLQKNGFRLLKNVVGEGKLDHLQVSLNSLKNDGNESAGLRHLLSRSPAVKAFANLPELLSVASEILGPKAQAVKAILFDKTEDTNWYVTWHQDLTISIQDKIEQEGFTSWSVKDGVLHVQPPAQILENIVSLRIHLDDCGEENGAIKFLAGSHKSGILDSAKIAAWRDNNQSISCPASRGDVILMRPLILHSSSQSKEPTHRRVLHIEYASIVLPGGLVWSEN